MVDYSKWKDIEISDDEDETHPNVDTPSLFRWRHQARLERMTELEKEEEQYRAKESEYNTKKKKLQKELDLATAEQKEEEVAEFRSRLAVLESELGAQLIKERTELDQKKKLSPWNVDTISKEGFTKTVINTPKKVYDDEANVSDEEKHRRQKEFVAKHESELKHFGMLRRLDDSKRYLQDRLELVCEQSATYLALWCLNLQMEEKEELMRHVAHQCICMQYILELARQLEIDPRACVGSFFARMQVSDQIYQKAFQEELDSFRERIKRHAARKMEEALREAEEEEKLERQKRLGPAGLDPVDVYESLPQSMKDCFDKRDIPMLQKVLQEMPEAEARLYMKKCVDSGLWIPDGGQVEAGEEEEDPGEKEGEGDYAEAGDPDGKKAEGAGKSAESKD